MLACARIGATHSVIFGGFSRRRRRRPQQRREGEARHHRRRRLAARQGRAAQGERRCGAGEVADGREVHRLQPLQHSGRDEGRPRPLVARADGRRLAPTAPPSRSTASIRSSSSTPRGSTGKPKGVLHTTAGYLLGASLTHKWVFDLKEDDIYWCTADIGWVTGHSYIVYGPLAQRRDRRHVRRGAEPSARGPLLGDHREVPRQHLLHRADRDPRLRQVGRPAAEGARPVEPAAARHGRRADQSRGVDVVSRGDRRRALPDRRYLVADRDRRDHDRAAARRDRRRSPAARRGRCRASWPRSSTSRATRCRADQGGFLVIQQPWPAMLRTIYGDDERYKQHVLEPGAAASTSPPTARAGTRTATSGSWAASTTCSTSSGHRLSTMEVESALVHHPKVAEAAVVGKPDDIKGEGIACFVTLKQRHRADATS